MKNSMRSIAVFGIFGLVGACAAPVDVGSENDTQQNTEAADQNEASEPGSDDDETGSVEQAAVNYSRRFVKVKVVYTSPSIGNSEITRFCYNNSSCTYACAGAGKAMKTHWCVATGPKKVTQLVGKAFVTQQEYTTACFCKL